MTNVRDIHVDAPGTQHHGRTFGIALTPGHDLIIENDAGSLVRLRFSGRHLDEVGSPEVWIPAAFERGG